MAASCRPPRKTKFSPVFPVAGRRSSATPVTSHLTVTPLGSQRERALIGKCELEAGSLELTRYEELWLRKFLRCPASMAIGKG